MGGAVGDNELHIGYIRLICFSGDSPTTSVQDFIWYSSNEDVVTVSKNYVDEKGNKTTREVINDGPKKLAARRAIKAKVYMVKEPRKEGEKKAQYIARMDNIKDPVVEKIFNFYAPKYAERAKELGQGGGYLRLLKTGKRRGDNADMAIIEFV